MAVLTNSCVRVWRASPAAVSTPGSADDERTWRLDLDQRSGAPAGAWID